MHLTEALFILSNRHYWRGIITSSTSYNELSQPHKFFLYRINVGQCNRTQLRYFVFSASIASQISQISALGFPTFRWYKLLDRTTVRGVIITIATRRMHHIHAPLKTKSLLKVGPLSAPDASLRRLQPEDYRNFRLLIGYPLRHCIIVITVTVCIIGGIANLHHHLYRFIVQSTH